MNQDTKRLILASILIFLVVVLQQPIFKALGYTDTVDPKPNVPISNEETQTLDQNDSKSATKEKTYHRKNILLRFLHAGMPIEFLQ